jgi:hypothetical protein
MNTSNLDSTRVALHCSGEASTTPLTKTPGHLHNLLEGFAVSTPPSHLCNSQIFTTK